MNGKESTMSRLGQEFGAIKWVTMRIDAKPPIALQNTRGSSHCLPSNQATGFLSSVKLRHARRARALPFANSSSLVPQRTHRADAGWSRHDLAVRTHAMSKHSHATVCKPPMFNQNCHCVLLNPLSDCSMV